ncbi:MULTISPECIES: family 20 glycosylhydrolase [unclassified Stenotrophomonas]|uniref:beta-N-acetylhexosaminidase n=1 Tax=unclassified Stenotrophomonas TaxID=196198 RepID=UPI00177D5156|nr:MULTISPECIES: family 20 glycosylhydrolase [unclassified Stenotrophomonas]MBD8636111.1 family 20 glycosylhydrolase [Stenotrophomonas sp. CFBP 13725]MBD8695564.1 family 20 glycosylhydrolase [Stenotrophomonas sp. CFBP 13718]
MRLVSLAPLLLSMAFAPLALANDPPAIDNAPGPQLRSGSVMVIPAPAQVHRTTGEGFTITAATSLQAEGTAARRVAAQFADLLARSGGPTLVPGKVTAQGGVRFVLDRSAPATRLPATPDERYVLESTARGITVRATSEAGLFYGATTLAQLATGGSNGLVPPVRIEDAPRFTWRGLMLDSARHFQSLDEIKQVLDAMAAHKLNTFHWHLTDDQGWRMEIKRYPKLTEVGSCRIPAGDGGRDAVTGAPRPYCGFYTQQQIREVIAYAAALHIQVIPEIDVPGHATAAIAAYPELGVLDTPLQPLSEWGVFPNLFNTEESTFVFLENVLEEVIDLFPAAYVHVGGDEAVKDQWIASARVQQRMKELGATDEMQMQSHLIKRLETFLEQHDRRLIGWDEILEGGLPPQATVMSWRGTEGGLKAASEGHDVVMSPVTDMYMDYLQTASPNEPPGRPLLTTLARTYAFEPVPATLAADKQHHILGLQANMFTEHTRTHARLQHNLFPRLAAVAETGWSPVQQRDFRDFLARLPAQLQRYRAWGLAYAQTPFEVAVDHQDDRRTGSVQVRLANPLGYEVRYRTDGQPVTADATLYTSPLQATVPVTVQAAAFFNGQPLAAAPTQAAYTARSLLTRRDDELLTCPGPGQLLLRLEDDGPADGPRAVFNVNIFNPCWRWADADLTGIRTLKVRAGRIPYYFQLAHDEPQRKFEAATRPHGEMKIRRGDCSGPALAEVPLPANLGADGFITLEAALPKRLTGKGDLCINFTGDTRPAMWVLDEVTLAE